MKHIIILAVVSLAGCATNPHWHPHVADNGPCTAHGMRIVGECRTGTVDPAPIDLAPQPPIISK